ncbi:MAG: hypothetical protein WCG10_04995 [Chlamydiota bacterium]
MIQSKLDILGEIDLTIDRLLENSEALKAIASNTCYQEEIFALEKTQESLIAHLIHMDGMLKKKDHVYKQKEPLLTSTVHEKLGRSGYLNQISDKQETCFTPIQEESYSKKPKIHKRKAFAVKNSSR